MRPCDVIRVRAAPDQCCDLMHGKIAIGIGADEILARNGEQCFGLFLRCRGIEARAQAALRQRKNAFALFGGFFRHVGQDVSPRQCNIGLRDCACEQQSRRRRVELRRFGGCARTFDTGMLLAEQIERIGKLGLNGTDPLRRARVRRRDDVILAETLARFVAVECNLRIGCRGARCQLRLRLAHPRKSRGERRIILERFLDKRIEMWIAKGFPPCVRNFRRHGIAQTQRRRLQRNFAGRG